MKIDYSNCVELSELKLIEKNWLKLIFSSGFAS